MCLLAPTADTWKSLSLSQFGARRAVTPPVRLKHTFSAGTPLQPRQVYYNKRTIAMNEALTSDKILEFIFLAVDLQTVLTGVVRVCQQWQSIVLKSTPLQRHLFFEPVELPTSSTKVERARRLNPLLQEAFPLWFQLPEHRPDVWAGFAHQPTAMARTPHTRQPEARKALTRRGATWRRMLVQQPPLYKLGIIVGETAYFTDVLEFPDGLRMGTLYDLVYSYACRNDNPASWCMAWSPALPGQDDVWSLDDTVAYWMEKSDLPLALFVVKFDSWGARVLRREDRRLEGGPVEWASLKCAEHEDVEVNARFYFLPR